MAAEREEYAEIGLQRKKEAEEVVELLRTQMARRVEAERQIDGLIIVQASYYGVHQPQEAADVTIPLQALVRHSQLAIPGGRSKVGLVGFWDPCMGETNKVLEVDYIFRGRKHKVIVNDEAYLLIPLRGHAVL